MKGAETISEVFLSFSLVIVIFSIISHSLQYACLEPATSLKALNWYFGIAVPHEQRLLLSAVTKELY